MCKCLELIDWWAFQWIMSGDVVTFLEEPLNICICMLLGLSLSPFILPGTPKPNLLWFNIDFSGFCQSWGRAITQTIWLGRRENLGNLVTTNIDIQPNHSAFIHSTILPSEVPIVSNSWLPGHIRNEFSSYWVSRPVEPA